MKVVEKSARERLEAWLASGKARIQPLTFPQREIWENSPVPPEDPANHVCTTISIEGQLPFEVCEEALSAVVARQEALRTTFLQGQAGVAQVIRATADAGMRFRDAPRPEQVLDEIFARPFDLVRGPLYRVEMLRMTPTRHLLALVFHHAIADGWSIGTFVQDFTTACVLALRAQGRSVGSLDGVGDSLPPCAMSYSQWAALERKRWTPALLTEKAAYWSRRLEGICPAMARDGGLRPLRRRTTSLPQDLVRSLAATAKSAEATLFSALLSAFRFAMFRWIGVRDLVVGTPHANRSNAATRETMGYFSGVVPLRGSVIPDRPFREVLAEDHARVVEDFSQAMPFAELVRALQGQLPDARHPVFDVRFALQNHPVPDFDLPGLSTRLRTRSTGTSRFDIGCELTEVRGGLEVVWLSREPAGETGEILELDRLFRETIAAAVANPHVPLASIAARERA